MSTTTGDPGFGTLLKRYRGAAGLTQEALAERAGLSARGISDLERGVSRGHRDDTVQRLVAALGLSAREREAFAKAARRVGHPGSGLPEAPRSGPPNHLPPLVGRSDELALLERHLSGQGPPVLLFAGEPGIGKSRLLHEAMRRASDSGWRVLQGGCTRRAGQEPYAPLLGALEGYLQRRDPLQLRADIQGCGWLVRLLPELADSPIEPLPNWVLTPEQERRLMFKAVARFLTNVAGPAGTLLLLDDLQWAGADAIDLIDTLARWAVGPPTDASPSLRVVGTYRSTEVQPREPLSVHVADLAQAEVLTHHKLDVLAAAEATILLNCIVDEDSGPALRELVLQRAGGVPYFLVSCARSLRGGASPDEVPWDLAQSIRQRLAALPEGVRELLGAAAVMGRQVVGPLLSAVATQSERAVLAAVEVACQAHLLEDTGQDGYRFAHDVIREVIEADLGTARRTMLHRRVATVLEREPDERPVEVLAYHYARGRVPDKAVMYLEQSGDRATVQNAHVAAAGYYRELVDYLDRLGRAQAAAGARVKLGTALATVAQYDTALAEFDEAATTYEAGGDLEGSHRTLALIGHAHANRGTPEAGVRRLRPVLERYDLAATTAVPGPGLVAVYTALAHLYLSSSRYKEQLEAATRAADLARTMGDAYLLAGAEFQRGLAYQNWSEALPVLLEAGRLAEAAGNLGILSIALNVAGCAYEDRGEFAKARLYTERALAAAEQRGDPAMIAHLTDRRGMCAFFIGDWAQARIDFEQALALCRQIGESWASPYPLLDLGRLCLAEGACAEASRYLEESSAMATRTGNLNPLRWSELVLAERDVLAGQPAAACARLRPLLDRPGQQELQVVFLLSTLAWACLELRDVGEAEALVEQSVSRARADDNLRALVDTLRVQAMVFTRQQRWPEAADALDEGLRLARGMPYQYAEGRLQHVYGEMRAIKGEPRLAQERLEDALAIFRRLGACNDIERAQHGLEALRVDS